MRPDAANHFARALAAETVPEAEAELLLELESDWTKRTSADWAATYARHCPVDGVADSEYMWRHLSDPDVGEVLAGIHFLGLDGTKPFVGVRAWTPADPARLADLSRLLAREWAAFRPGFFQIFRPSGPWESPGATVDQHLMVGRLEELRQQPPGSERVKLLPRNESDAESFATRCTELYQQVFAQRPFMTDLATPADAADLRACAQAGAFFEIEVDGQSAGVVAARNGRCLAWSGAEMVEEVLEPRWWGQGLGTALQRNLVDALPARLGPFLWGTIDGANAASLRTAERVGRRVVGSWWFMPLPAD